MDIKEVLLTKSVDILESAPILFDNIAYTYQSEENELNYKLYLIQKGKSNYAVCAITRYMSDNDFTSFLQAHDKISHPLSFHFHKEFHDLKEARIFYEDVLKQCPTRIDLKHIVSKTCKIYGFDSRKSVNYDFHLGVVREDEFFKKEFIRHGYQRIFIRMFRLKQKIIINKNLTLEFDSEGEAQQTFSAIQEHFSNCELALYECQNEETEFNTLLEDVVTKALQGERNHIEINAKRDFLDRITSLKVRFAYKGVSYLVEYSLPTRNGNYHGYDMDGVIRKDPGTGFRNSSYETYRTVHSFKEDLVSVLES